jgi:hypothetical protein
MIALGIATAVRRNTRDGTTERDLAGRLADRRSTPLDLPHIGDVHTPAIPDDLAMVGDLTARLRVKRRLTQQHGDATIVEPTHRGHQRVDLHGVVPHEARRWQDRRPRLGITRRQTAPRIHIGEIIRADAELSGFPLRL